MPTVEVLIGMIASGKSTYARRRADAGALVVAHDDLTAMLHARPRYEPGLRAWYRAMQIDLAERAVQAGRDVVVDRTHLTREAREMWTRVFRMKVPFDRPGDRVIAVEFPVEPAQAHARRRFEADDRGRPYTQWLAVAEHHAAQALAEPLDWQAEGFDAWIGQPDRTGPAGSAEPIPALTFSEARR